MDLDRQTFFAYARRAPFGGGLSTAQVAGCNRILDTCLAERVTDLRQIAYVLASVFHETGGRMQPVRETFATSDAQAIARLDKAWKAGKLGQVETPYWRKGWFGRGDIQITHEANYATLGAAVGVDLVRHPELALDPQISARIAVIGMRDGLFSGARLGDFFTGAVPQPIKARRIVNGSDKARLIETHWRAFLDALKAADETTPMPDDVVAEAAQPDDVAPRDSRSLLMSGTTFLGGVTSLPFLGNITGGYALGALALIVVAGGIIAWLVMSGRITINRSKALA